MPVAFVTSTSTKAIAAPSGKAAANRHAFVIGASAIHSSPSVSSVGTAAMATIVRADRRVVRRLAMAAIAPAPAARYRPEQHFGPLTDVTA
jgi:hypothetical protein